MAKREKLEYRIRYDENWHGEGEYYIFEVKRSNDREWGLDTAFKLLDYENEKGSVISYKALTKIRELQKLGINFWFC